VEIQRSEEMSSRLYLHQGKLSHKSLLTEAEKQIDECYCKNPEKLLQQNGKENVNPDHPNEKAKWLDAMSQMEGYIVKHDSNRF